MSVPCDLSVPHISVQSDWHIALRNLNGTAWCSYKFRGQPSVQCMIKNTNRNSEQPFEITQDELTVEKVSQYVIAITHTETSCTFFFKAPDTVFESIHGSSVNALDTTATSGASVCSDNNLVLWKTVNGQINHTLNGHLADVSKIKFFPSGVVMLSGSADMSLKIWDASNGTCVCTLQGHTGTVTDFCMVDRGKNVISVAKDGLAKIWSCGHGSCAGDLFNAHASINCCCLTNSDEVDQQSISTIKREHEFGTENKILILGCEDGMTYVLEVYTRRLVFSKKQPAAVNNVCLVGNSWFALGCHDGSIRVYHKSSGECILLSWDSLSPILGLISYQSDCVIVGRKDGTCTLYQNMNRREIQPIKRLSFTGPDFDQINAISYSANCVYTACRDRKIRVYRINDDLINLLLHNN